jgi:predicted metal-dependent phosphoesterase TrpH
MKELHKDPGAPAGFNSDNPNLEKKAEQLRETGAVLKTLGRPDPGKMKIDLHCHTEASPDSSTPLGMVLRRCRERKVRIQAITDHNVIWGAQQLQDLQINETGIDHPPVSIIVGEEISTSEGELVGLFLKEKIEAGLSPEQTVDRIHSQGGLVLLPHGFDPLKRFRLKTVAVERILRQIDIVETFNARISRPRWNQAAVTWAQQYGLPMSAGSDAHTIADIGSAWVEVPLCEVHTPQDLLDALQGGIPVGQWTHPLVAYLHKLWDRIRRRIRASPRLAA